MQQNGNSGLRCLNMSGTPVAASYRRWSTREGSFSALELAASQSQFLQTAVLGPLHSPTP